MIKQDWINDIEIRIKSLRNVNLNSFEEGVYLNIQRKYKEVGLATLKKYKQELTELYYKYCFARDLTYNS